ncbi:hypothetical protein SPLC1_S520190 [Arthrospira platensis C1]|nr:hypothetical protein SPLC1_S520190 [Arthrospira platensis C1]
MLGKRSRLPLFGVGLWGGDRAFPIIALNTLDLGRL